MRLRRDVLGCPADDSSAVERGKRDWRSSRSLRASRNPRVPRSSGRHLTQRFKANDEKWNSVLRVGFAPGSEWPETFLSFSATQAAAAIKDAKPVAGGLELVFLQSTSVDDGRYANNSWLQETPDFETKVTWDNVALVSPATAKKLGIRANNFGPIYQVAEKLGNDIDFDIVADVIEIKSGGASVVAAAFVAPGHADDSISLALGYGRTDVSALLGECRVRCVSACARRRDRDFSRVWR